MTRSAVLQDYLKSQKHLLLPLLALYPMPAMPHPLHSATDVLLRARDETPAPDAQAVNIIEPDLATAWNKVQQWGPYGYRPSLPGNLVFTVRACRAAKTLAHH